MVISTPFSKSIGSKAFVLDLISAMEPDVIYVTDEFILDDTSSIHSRYANILDGVDVQVLSVTAALRRPVNKNVKVLNLLQFDKLIKSTRNNEWVAKILQSSLLLPSDCEIGVNLERLTDTLIGELC